MLVKGSTETIGVVVCNSELLLHDGFVPQVLHAIVEVNRVRGFRVLLDVVDAGSRPDAYSRMVDSRQIDGLIVIDPATDDPELRTLIEDGFPIVLLGSVRHPEEHSVNFSTRQGVEMVVDHLIGLGHRRIAHVTYSPAGYVATDTRLNAFSKALGKHGLATENDLVEFGRYSAESGYEAMNRLLGRTSEPPTAVFAGNDTIALGVMASIRDAGLLVPEDISVVGFDNLKTSAMIRPALTTVNNPAPLQGRTAAEMLASLLEGASLKDRRVRTDLDLVVRDTTAPPRS
jgi:LacI family transcriptional regulator